MRAIALCLLLLAASACADPPDKARIAAGADMISSRHSALLRWELQGAATDDGAPRHLYYFGLALYSDPWSENDVVDVGEQLARAATSYRVVPVILSNRQSVSYGRYPFVDKTSVESAVQLIGARARPGDVVVVFISTHGGPGLLAQRIGTVDMAPVGAKAIASSLAPLADHDLIIIISACYSGSLIPFLKSDDRIVFTAARSDRKSFGCGVGSQHTYFAQALLDALQTPNVSLGDIVARTRDEVAELERRNQATPPSEPQVSVGTAVAELYSEPVF